MTRDEGNNLKEQLINDFFNINGSEKLYDSLMRTRILQSDTDSGVKLALLKKYCRFLLASDIRKFRNKMVQYDRNAPKFNALEKQVKNFVMAAHCFDINNLPVFWEYGIDKIRSSINKLVFRELYNQIPLNNGASLNELFVELRTSDISFPIGNENETVIVYTDNDGAFLGTFCKETPSKQYLLKKTIKFRGKSDDNEDNLPFSDVQPYEQAFVYGKCELLSCDRAKLLRSLLNSIIANNKIESLPLFYVEEEKFKIDKDNRNNSVYEGDTPKKPKEWIEEILIETKSILGFLDSLSSYEKFIFTNHINSSDKTNILDKFKRVFNYYPNFNDECDLLNTCNLIVNTKKTFQSYVQKSEAECPDFDELRNKVTLYSSEFNSNSSTFETLITVFKDVFKADNPNPYDEMIFLNIDPVKEYKQYTMNLLDDYTCPIVGEYRNQKKNSIETITQETFTNEIQKQYEKSKFEKFAKLLNYLRDNEIVSSDKIPDNIFTDKSKAWEETKGKPFWKELREDPLMKEMRDNVVEFTPEDIQTTKARLKVRYDIFCGKEGVKAKAPRKKKGKKASS